jgi:hypothetical protein
MSRVVAPALPSIPAPFAVRAAKSSPRLLMWSSQRAISNLSMPPFSLVRNFPLPMKDYSYISYLQEIFVMMDFLRLNAMAVPNLNQDWPGEIVRGLCILSRGGDFVFTRNGTMRYEGYGMRTALGTVPISNHELTSVNRIALHDLATPFYFLPRIHYRLREWIEIQLQEIVKKSHIPSALILLLKLYHLDFLDEYLIF